MSRDSLTVNGVKVGGDQAASSDATREITLPSGRRASIRTGVGRDLMKAQRAAGPNADSSMVLFALIAELSQVEGERLVYEDVLKMEIADVVTLQAEVAGANFPDPPPQPSQDLFASDSGSAISK